MPTPTPPRVEGYPPEVGSMPLGGFMDSLDFAFDLMSPDRLEAHLVTGPRHHQPYGIVHGGVYAAVVETMASVGAGLRTAADGNAVVGVSNTTDFLRAHRTGRLDCVAEPVHVGRSQQLWQVTIARPDDGKLVARGQVRLQVIPGDRDLAGAPATVEGGA